MTTCFQKTQEETPAAECFLLTAPFFLAVQHECHTSYCNEPELSVEEITRTTRLSEIGDLGAGTGSKPASVCHGRERG